MRGEAPNIQDNYIQPLYLRNFLTIDMHQNIEKKFLFKVPKEITKTSLNVRYYNTNTPPKYVALIIPTLKGKQSMEGMISKTN